MAEIARDTEPSRTHVLEPEHLVGRGPQCSLRLTGYYVSAQHAVVRWSGARWEVIDRGSRNGTVLDGEPLQPGRPYPLGVGSRLAFGNADERWLVRDASPPEVMVVEVDSGRALVGTDGIVGIPSADEPLVTVYRDTDGTWRLEQPDRDTVALSQGTTFVAGSRTFRFCCPDAVTSTGTAYQKDAAPPIAVFSVSRDEEFVEVFFEYPDRRVSLGSRSHNYLLLTLARGRIADRAAGVPESSCGWTYKENLADALNMTPQQIDGEVFRVRKHFAQHGLDEAASVIDRRPRTKQIRLGLSNLRIVRI